MTLKELNEWCEQNNIPNDTPLTMDRGIDIIEDVVRVVHNGLDIVFIGGHIDDENSVI